MAIYQYPIPICPLGWFLFLYLIWFGSVAVTVISFLSVLLTTEPQEKAANENSQVKLEEKELCILRDMDCSL